MWLYLNRYHYHYMLLTIYCMGARNLKRFALFIPCLLFFLPLSAEHNKIVEINTLDVCLYISSCCQWLRCDEIAKSDTHKNWVCVTRFPIEWNKKICGSKKRWHGVQGEVTVCSRPYMESDYNIHCNGMYSFMRCGFGIIFRGRLYFAKTFKRHQSTVHITTLVLYTHPYIMVLNIWIILLVCVNVPG